MLHQRLPDLATVFTLPSGFQAREGALYTEICRRHPPAERARKREREREETGSEQRGGDRESATN